MHLIFVYGSLKRGYRLHDLLCDQTFMGRASTECCYRLFDLGEYPGLVDSVDGVSVNGEVYQVADHCLVRLDRAEGVDEGLYERRPIRLLQCPASVRPSDTVEAWFYRRSVSGLRDCGQEWNGSGSAS